ncbi:MAG: HNH endonuclease domain-containing protein [bacterium]
MAPTRGKTHDERFLENGNIHSLVNPSLILGSQHFEKQGKKIITDMMDSQNVFPVFEKRCPILLLKSGGIEMDIVAVDALLNNSTLYSKMGELICFQYLVRLSANMDFRSQLEDYFIRDSGRIDFSSTAKNYVLSFQDHVCYYCGRTLDAGLTQSKPKADHFIPWAFVKSSSVENLVFACHACNSDKSNRLASISFFNSLLRRNAPGSDFWRGYPEEISNLEERIDKWVRHYYQASEQLSTGWMPDKDCVCP